MIKQKKYKQNLYLQAFCRIFIHFTYKKFIYKPPWPPYERQKNCRANFSRQF